MSKTKQLKIHPIALMVPSMSAEAFEALKSDIAAHGMREKIWVKDGQIVDGRHRYKAARELGIAFETVEYTGDDVESFVFSMNLARRHLSASQRRWYIKRMLQLHPEQSDRQIAEVVGASDRTVSAARKDMESTAQIAQLTKTVGKDGKARERPEPRPLTHSLASLTKPGDLFLRRVMQELRRLHISEFTDPVLMVSQLRHELERLEHEVSQLNGGQHANANQ